MANAHIAVLAHRLGDEVAAREAAEAARTIGRRSGFDDLPSRVEEALGGR
jgi:hypothetical protein